MKKICLLLTFVFVMMLGAAALADMDVTELNVQFVPTNTETADALGIDYSAFNDLAGQVVEVTTAE